MRCVLSHLKQHTENAEGESLTERNSCPIRDTFSISMFQEEKGTTEDEMSGWHHWLDGRESGWTPGVGDGQGGLACCSPWGRKESDTTERLNWTDNQGEAGKRLQTTQNNKTSISFLLRIIPWVGYHFLSEGSPTPLSPFQATLISQDYELLFSVPTLDLVPSSSCL